MKSTRFFLVGLLVANCLTGCTRLPSEKNDPRSSPSLKPPFEEIGDRKLGALVEPGAYTFTRCGYRVEKERHDIPVGLSLKEASPTALLELGALLARVDEARKNREEGGLSRRNSVEEDRDLPAHRAYQLAVNRGWIADLEIEDPGPAGGTVRVNAWINGERIPSELRGASLLGWLRRHSFRHLQKAMTRPARTLPWHWPALARFLESGVTLPSEPGHEGTGRPIATDARFLPEPVLRNVEASADPRPIVFVLLEHLRAFEKERLDPFRSSGRIALRLLALARSAADGNRPDLNEILVLSLEYHNEAMLFDKTLRVLFPKEANPLLHGRHEKPGVETGGLAFAREIYHGLSRVVYDDRGKWTLKDTDE